MFNKIARKLIKDSRGYFLKVIDGNEPNNPFACEVYITSAKPGESKGGHYHVKAKEWFTLIQGQAEVTLINTITGVRTTELLDADSPMTLFVPEMIAHSFMNTSPHTDFILLAYTNVQFDKEDTIAF